MKDSVPYANFFSRNTPRCRQRTISRNILHDPHSITSTKPISQDKTNGLLNVLFWF